MTLLEEYEEQYASIIAEITTKIARLHHSNEADRYLLCSMLDGHFTETHDLLEQIGLEIQQNNTANKNQSSVAKLQCYRMELNRLQTDYNICKERAKKSKDAKNAISEEYINVSISDDQSQRLLGNSEVFETTSHHLTDGIRIATETEQIGAQVLNDLYSQREVIEGSRTRMREMKADLARASRTMSTMLARAFREKVVVYFVCFLFTMFIVVSLYFLVHGKNA